MILCLATDEMRREAPHFMVCLRKKLFGSKPAETLHKIEHGDNPPDLPIKGNGQNAIHMPSNPPEDHTIPSNRSQTDIRVSIARAQEI